MCILQIAHNGKGGQRAVDLIRSQLPRPIIDWAGPIQYTALQSMFDALYPTGLRWYWKGDFVKTLSDNAIQIHLEHAEKVPTPISAMHLYPIDGAVHRKGNSDTAWHCRDATWSMVIVGVGRDANGDVLKQWATDYWTALRPHDLEGAYPNFMMDDEGKARVHAAYGDNYSRLAALKRKYDPSNLFQINQNIPPA